MRKLACVSLTACVLLLPGVARAEDKMPAPLPRPELDRRVYNSLIDTVNVGSDLFNAGDRAACYRLYQGALIALSPLLDHRPRMREGVQNALKKAAALRTPAQQAFALRGVIDEILVAIRKDQLMATKRGKTLYERLGGEPAIKAVVDDFVARAAGDPKVNFTRKGTAAEWEASAEKVAVLKKHLVQFVSMVTGGPKKYEGRDMKAVHKGMMITDAEFNALAADLKATLDKFKVPEKEQKELLAIVGSTRDAIVEKK
jgi:hemoglobin